MQHINRYLLLYNITFAGRLTTETGTFQENRGYCAMSMLYFGMAWACVLLFRVCQYLVVEQRGFTSFFRPATNHSFGKSVIH